MSGEGYRILLRCRARSERLRAKGFTWDQIADVLALDNAVSPLRLYRFAHGRTAADVVNEFNDLDPAGTASLREGLTTVTDSMVKHRQIWSCNMVV